MLAASRQDGRQVRRRGRGLEHGIRERDERTVDQPAEGGTRQGDADRGERERDQARAPAGHDPHCDPPDVTDLVTPFAADAGATGSFTCS